MTDFYQALGVERNATPEDIKRAYRTQAMKNHPDRGGDVKQFQTIQEAYDTLSDPAKRQQYDNPQPQFQHFGGPGGFEFHFGGPGGGDPFQDIFAQFFGGRPVRPTTRVNLELDFELAVTGGKRMVGISGQTIEITIPEGIAEGEQRQYQGVGPGGTDLVVTFRVRPHPEFQRRGDDLYTVRALNFWDLILGTTLQFKSVKGEMINLVVPPRTRPSTVLRAKGHGIRMGSLLVELQAILPHSIPDDLVEHIKLVRDQQ